MVNTLASGRFRLPLVVGFYAIVTAVWTFPQVLHLADSISPVPDALLQSWVLAWDIHALTTQPLHLYDGNIYFPFPLSLTYSDAMLSGALIVAPILLFTGNAILAHNVLTLASALLAALGMYLLVRGLTGSDVGGLVAGCVFAFCASRQAHLEHVNLLQFGWLPFGLLCLHRAVQRGRAVDFLLFSLCTVLQALASVYLAWMTALAYAIFFAFELAFRRRVWNRQKLAALAGSLMLATSIVMPVMWPYAQMQQMYAFHWPTDVVSDFSARLTDYLAVIPRNVMYGAVFARFASANFRTEHILFPGFAALALAVGAVVRRPAHVEIWRYLTMVGVGFVLSLGPVLRLNDRGQGVPLPYSFLLQFVPGFAVMRVPSRFDFLLMLGLAVVAGFGTARLSARLARGTSPLARRLVLTGVVALALLELLPWPQTLAPISVGAGVPPVYGWLRTQAPEAVVAEIPVRGPGGYASYAYEYLSTYHWHPLVNGGSGFEPPASATIANQLDVFPDPSAVANLRSLGVRYLVAHRDQLGPSQRHQLDTADLSQLGLGIAATFGDDVVYALVPASPPAASLKDHVQLDLPSLVGRGTTPSVSVTISNDASVPMVVAAPQALSIQVEWDHTGSVQAGRQDLPIFFDPEHQAQLVFPVQLTSSLKAADSAQLSVRLTGSVDAQASQSVRIVDLPTSLDRTGLSGRVQGVHIPSHVSASAVMPLDVMAENTGQSTWLPDPPGTTGTRGVVGVSVRGWVRADGEQLPPSPNSTGHVGWNVNPGQSALVSLQTTAPAVPGHYQLVLDMLSESVTWFDDVQGGTRTLVPVDVEP